MTQHTPGPWTVEGGSLSHYFEIHAQNMKIGEWRDEAASCGYAEGTEACNARLIAAAPELLAACKEALMGIEGGRAMNSREIIADAIATAEGTTT